ncbi:MAG TPA: SDR family NAD(P)-dependent oxidoreductase [Syntrophomonadaceae bacterium]|nr:SDR family NAD(P)-dependent oxidoreductase [Syntrophomonadaceae bacterium]
MHENDVILNRYSHGCMVIPVIVACKKHGLFKTLSLTSPIPFNKLVTELQANSGHLRTALYMLESLNWISRSNKDQYLLTSESNINQNIPGNIIELMSIPMNEYLNKNKKKNSLKKWIELSNRRWDLSNQRFADFLDGMLVVPLFLALKENNFLIKSDNRGVPPFLILDPVVREEIIEFFTTKDWLTLKDGVVTLNDTGRYIADKINTKTSVATYKPMFMNISEVIFGNCRSVFERNLFDSEPHLDNTFNVIRKGFQNEGCFSKLEEIVLSIFNQEPFSEQPQYIAEIGCRDGVLLKSIYELVKNESSRGKVLNEYPIKLIGIDTSEKALEKATHTLKDTNHLVVKGDISNPEQIIIDLKSLGIKDVENILHIRSFLDHKRSYILPLDISEAISRSKIPCDTVHVDREGNAIPAAFVMQNLVEHLARWSSIPSKHGLIIREEHCLDPKTVSGFIDSCESLHIDAYHRFSQQLLVEANQFLIAAAEANLFPKQDSVNKYPKTMQFSQMTLNHFERREYRVRYAQKKDLPFLEELESQCWESGLRTPVSVLKKRLERYPEGQLVLEIDNKVVGVIYSQRVTSSIKSASMETVERLHRKKGTIVQLLAVNVLPELQHKNLGDQLLEYMLQLCSLMNGVDKVVAVTRCKDYHRHADTNFQEYIRLRNEQGRLVDTILRFHELHGAQIKGLIPNYRTQDKKNQGYGVYIEYDIHNRQRRDIQVGSYSTVKTGIEDDTESIKDFLVKTIISILGEIKEEAFSLDRPMMEMGLDSPDLLELKEKISCKYQVQLESAFFFIYNTAERVIAYLQDHNDTGKEKDITEIIEEKGGAIVAELNAGMQEKGIAIIGISCRLPGGVMDKEQLWELLTSGKDAISRLPIQRWKWPDHIDLENKHKGIDLGGFLHDIACFDAYFFRISPKEAELMDPQQRIMLELSWECLEDAGYPVRQVSGSKTGVFIGASGSDYNKLLERNLVEIEAYYGTGTSMAVLPNRLSYFYDFNGPSIQIDTACSSSLVAVHEAVRSLQAGECDQALVGGINIICHPSMSIAFYKAGMLAKDGKCKTFDKKANGYVRGEGAVMILLKPLDQALADQDSIYAVIKRTAINHGGQASGLTVPNPDKQAALLIEAYKSTNIEPETIGYIETHGTGTSLGDPIEISGLKKAFSQLSRSNGKIQEPYCGLGSIKTNIGHLEAAAGIAGLLKVVLSLQHQVLPASINFSELNPQIVFDQAQFYVVNKTQPWELAKGQSFRRAGVSSFGSGGTNAHLVLEEAPVITRKTNNKFPAYLICLSAKTEEALRQKELDLLEWIKKEGEKSDLFDISATLLIGREHFRIRAAYMVRDVRDMQSKLDEVIKNGWAEGYFTNRNIEQKNLNQPVFFELGQTILNELKGNKKTNAREYDNKLTALAELYAKGYDLDWKALYSGNTVPRISLPTYPFARKRYWVPEIDNKFGITTNPAGYGFIHPLLHQNTSDLTEQRFSSTFTGQEFFLKDHVVKGQRILPGVAYLEMARAAVEQAAGQSKDRESGIQLKNIVWAKPVIVGEEPVKVSIGLYPEENGEIAYEIYSESVATKTKANIHSQGYAVLSSRKEASTLDLNTLLAECCQSSLTSNQCYEVLKKMGLDYGPGHRGIKEVYVGSDQALVRLSLSSSILDTQDQYVLHPSLMDSALQASNCLMRGLGDPIQSDCSDSFNPVVPFALEKLEILGKCAKAMWALIRYSPGSQATDKVQKLDIDLSDDYGNICVQMKGFSSRVLKSEADSAGVAASTGTLMIEPCWREKAIAEEIIAPEYTEHLVMLCEPNEVSQESIETQMNGVRCLALESNQDSIQERFQNYVLQVFVEVQSILKDKAKGKMLVQIVVSRQNEQQLFTGLSGLLKTAQLENSKIIGQLIEVEPGEDSESIIEKLKENSRSPGDKQIRYRDGKRYVLGWNEIEVTKEEAKIPWKAQGVYLITGGAGGLGLIFAKEIAQKVKDATLILTGRSELDKEKQARLKEIESMGARVEYKQVDVTDQEAVTGLIQGIIGQFGELNGIIHSAGVIKDNFIIKKAKEEIEEVLAPKVKGLVNLDQASQDLSLDFLILFSSVAASLGNLGQADYAAANAFMDTYARYRNSLVGSMQRQGQTLSINWSLWKEGGMQVDKETEKMMMQTTGMDAIQTSTGIHALYQGIASGKDQVMILEGHLPRMKQKLLFSKIAVETELEKREIAPALTKCVDAGSMLDKVQTELKQIVSKLLKVGIADIDVDIKLSEYGFDSILFTQFTNVLGEEYKIELMPTIFFEYETIQSFVEYLLKKHQAVFAKRYAVEDRIENTMPAIQEKEIASNKGHSRFTKRVELPSLKQNAVHEPIAIVGISGIFPMAKNIDEFWENLVEGKDCIREIPKERWDWREYYGDPTKEENITNIKWGGFIEGIDEFDPLFFGISPREAELMDPQQRLLMTYVWKAIEDSGYSAQSLWGSKTAIFVGTANSGYSELITQANVTIQSYSSTGRMPSVGPNRMSYFLNIHGPSEPIETACSSSLVAIHRAVSAIESGYCEMAIAGGINTLLTPEAYISFSKAGMLCEDGRCKTFSDKANGYVRGEGVGMIFLKKLKDAEGAGDHIYGIIRGSAENHGGRANSLTAPNPKAQTELLIDAYTKARVDPRTISYIEAHGTGTELGDPIEINGLKAAFKKMYQDIGSLPVIDAHCGLGSVKTNIGHLELAAGIAGVLKVILQLKHKTLVKNLYCNTINPYIQLKDSPFYIVQETQKWKAIKDDKGNDLPRRAGVSSFGFGGVNAHVVIEEYIPQELERPTITISPKNPAIIVLSAKNEERLKEQAQQLLTAIKERQYTEKSFPDMAYTLQVGRDAMEERLGMIVASLKELEEKLQGFVDNTDNIEDFYRGQVKRNKDTLAVFAADAEMQEAINKWIKRRKYTKLLDLWVKGLNFDWNKLYKETKHQRISLPTYPFAKERYWIPEKDGKSASITKSQVNAVVLHPLLHQNTSDLSGQRFSSIFTGQEFFLKDHVVQGQRVLPGVAYLEMARAAMDQATASLIKGQPCIRLKNVVWTRPIVVRNQPVQVHIGIYPEENGEIAYEIYGESKDGNKDSVVYSEGYAVLSSPKEVLILDLNALQAECSQSILTSSQCYELFGAMGIEYGSGFQGIEKIYIGAGGALAELSLPFSVFDTKNHYVLHPSLMDSALQASIGLMMGLSTSQGKIAPKPSMAFALQSLEITGGISPKMWAFIRYSESIKTEEPVQKLDIDLCDDQGKVCVRMKEFSLRVLEVEIDTDSVSKANCFEGFGKPFIETIMLAPVWDSIFVEQAQAIPSSSDQVLIIGGTTVNWNVIKQQYPKAQILDIEYQDTIDVMAKKLSAYSPIDHIIWLAPHKSLESLIKDELIEEQNQGVLYYFRMIKALLGLGYGTKDLDWSVITIQSQPIHKNDVVNPTHTSLYGLIGSMAKEYPNWKIRLIDLEANCDWPIKNIFNLPLDKQGNTWVYRGQEWYRQKLIPVHYPPLGQTLYKQAGTYVVIGGAGGIGEVWSKYMIRTYQAQVIWIGRRQKDKTIQAKMDRLATLGPVPEYITADATDRKALQHAYEEIKQRYSHIHGVIHAAVSVLDQSLANMEEERFKAGLSAKVDVSVRLAQIFHKEPLDFIIFFSSIASFTKDHGKSSYASGSTFEDVFAHQLAQELSCLVKTMNWGYWGNVGIGSVVPDAFKNRLIQAGIGSIESPEAMEALEILLSGPMDQIALLKATKTLIMDGISSKEFIAAYSDTFPASIQKMQNHIREKISQISSKREGRG